MTVSRHNSRSVFLSVCLSTHHFDELEELDDGRVEEVVSSAVVQQGVDDGLEEVPFDDVAVVILVLQTDDPAHEAQSTWRERKRERKERQTI